MSPIGGIHHVTAMCGDPQRNVDFYAGLLGLSLVKVTVNYDDPGTYHLYYGDSVGKPGTILTFFPWPDSYRGLVGTRQVATTAFAVSLGAFEHWQGRLHAAAVPTYVDECMGERTLSFNDPDEMPLEIVESPHVVCGDPNSIRGIHSASIWLESYERSARVLTDVMGLIPAGEEENRSRFALPSGQFVDLLCLSGHSRGHAGVGTVHHIAWRVADEPGQLAWRDVLTRAGHDVTPVRDRTYFRSIYFREPGGVLYEIATDSPGFAVDEPADRLGMRLTLPGWLEPQRDRIRAKLQAFSTPKGGRLP